MTETERLKKELTEAKAEIDNLNLRLNNVTFLLRQEMAATGKNSDPTREKLDPASN